MTDAEVIANLYTTVLEQGGTIGRLRAKIDQTIADLKATIVRLEEAIAVQNKNVDGFVEQHAADTGTINQLRDKIVDLETELKRYGRLDIIETAKDNDPEHYSGLR